MSLQPLPSAGTYRGVYPPHWPGVPPPPHVSGEAHVPHWIKLPHPSPAGPQVMFCCWQVTGTHAP